MNSHRLNSLQVHGPLNLVGWLQLKDEKLWWKEEAYALSKMLRCNCNRCDGGRTWTQKVVREHLIAFGHDPTLQNVRLGSIRVLHLFFIPKWNVFNPKYWNYTFGLVDSFLEDNKCIVFIQGVDANFVGQVKACVEGSFGFELKKKYYCINSITSSTPNPEKWKISNLQVIITCFILLHFVQVIFKSNVLLDFCRA